MARSLTFPEGSWQSLLDRAYGLIDAIADDGVKVPSWSLGGGTVLMFHYGHRLSKDIDIFVPDPQFLGYVNPRLGGRAEDITSDYSDSANYVKLFFPEGEVDFVASQSLTNFPFETYVVRGREIFLETPVEIVAKKIWHRGDRATPRDLLDLALVIEKEYDQLIENKEFFIKNIGAFVEQCTLRRDVMVPVFNNIETLSFGLTFEECLERVAALKDKIAGSASSRMTVPTLSGPPSPY